jgi:mono/diheme cytochrome c family protein
VNRHALGIPLFGISALVVFALFGVWVTDLQGQKSGGGAALSGDISPEAGRELFWGKGKCYTCHSIGTEGSGQRCPNLGSSDQFADPIWIRAAERKAAEGYSRERYIVESIYRPNAYVVEGFSKGLMKPINRPPIALSDDEITSVIAYLLSEAGAADVPDEYVVAVRRAQQEYASAPVVAEAAAPGVPLPEGDSEEGYYVFEEMQCHSCHRIEGYEFEAVGDAEGGVGPDLTAIADIQTREYLAESIMEPSAVIVAGEGFVGEDGLSKMPEFHDTMTLREFVDIVAFLESLKSEGGG